MAVGLAITAGAGSVFAASGDRCSATAAQRDAIEAECVGRTAVSVGLTNCPPEVCLDRARIKTLVSVTDLDDRPIADGAFEVAVARLRKTGYFRDAVVRCTPTGGGVAVKIDLCANSVIESVDISGNRFFRDNEIRKRIFLRPGQVLNANPSYPAENERVQRQVLALKRLYQREGIALRRTPRIDVRKTGIKLALTVVIEEADRQGVRDLQAKHTSLLTAPSGPAPADGGHSCPIVDPETIEDIIGFSRGDVISARGRKQASKKLEKWFRSVGFVSPEADVRQDTNADGAAVLKAEVRTTHCWEIRLWERPTAYSGAAATTLQFKDPVGRPPPAAQQQASYKRLDLNEWRQLLPFAESGVFDRQEAARGLGALEKRLEAQGFFFAQVRMEHRPFSRGKGPVIGRVDYFMTKNYERRLQKVGFIGLKAVTRDEVESVTKTRSYAFLDGSSALQVAKVFDDLSLIQRYYNERGFYAFRFLITGNEADVAPQTTMTQQGEWLVWEHRFRDRGFRVKKRLGEVHLYLEVPLAEGPRTKVGAVNLVHDPGDAAGSVVAAEGNAAEGKAAEGKAAEGKAGTKTPRAATLLMSPKVLAETVTLKQGQAFGTASLRADVKAIKRWYRRRGYHGVTVNLTCEAFEPEPMDGLCDPRRVQGGRVDLTFRVVEGRRFTVGEVMWRGNFRTDDDILVRDLPKPGEPFNVDKVNDALRRMRRLGIFNAARVDVIGLEERPARSKVGLVVTVEEAPARYLDLSLSFRNINRADVGSVPPLLATIVGQSIASSDRQTTGLARPRAVSLPDILLVFGVEYVDLNVLGLAQELRIPVEYGISTLSPIRLAKIAPTWTIPWRIGDQDLRMEWALTAVLSDQVSEVKDFTEFSAGMTLTLPLPDRMTVALQVSGGANSFGEPDAEIHPIEGPYDPFVRAALRWRWDQQDNPLNPRKGWALSTSLSGVIAKEIDTGNLEFRNYFKWEASARAALDLSAFVLAGYFRYGGSTATDSDPLPTRERYSLGGSNGMRGFADNAVGRYDADGELLRPEAAGKLDTGGNVLVNFNLELRFPLIPDIWLWGVVFTDMGALAADHASLHPSSFRFSAGFGLRLLIFDQIPVRLDFGFPLERRCAQYYTDSTQVGAGETAGGCAGIDDAFNYHINVLYPF